MEPEPALNSFIVLSVYRVFVRTTQRLRSDDRGSFSSRIFLSRLVAVVSA